MDVMTEIDNYLQNKSLIAEYIEPLVCELEGLMCIRLIKPVKITLLDELLEKGVYYFEEPPNETFSNHPIEEVGDLVSNSYLYVENKEHSTADNLNFKPMAFYGAVITLGALYLSIALNEIQKQNPSINVTEELEKQLHESKQPKTEKPIEKEITKAETSLMRGRCHSVLMDLCRTNKKHALKTATQTSEILRTGKTQLSRLFENSNANITGTTQIVMAFLIAKSKEKPITNDLTPLDIKFTLDEWIDAKNLVNSKDTRKEQTKTIRRELDILKSFSISYDNMANNEGGFINFLEAGNIENGLVTVRVGATFKQTFLCYRHPETGKLTGSFDMVIPRSLFEINPKYNPYSFNLYFKLCSHCNANKGEKNQYTISVKKLLEYLPHEKVENIDPKYLTRRLIKPLERDLNRLEEANILTWDYSHSLGLPLTDEEQNARLSASGQDRNLPYKIAIDSLIYFNWINDEVLQYFDVTEKKRDAVKQRKQEAKQKAIKKKQASKKRIQTKKENIIAKEQAKKELENF